MKRRAVTIAVLSVILACTPVPGVSRAWADEHEDEHSASDGAADSGDGPSVEASATADGDIDMAGEDDAAGIDEGHDAARQAVQADQAIPLGRVLEIFRGYGDFTVVDLALVTRSGRLFYRIKYIDPQGRVRQSLLDARTGSWER